MNQREKNKIKIPFGILGVQYGNTNEIIIQKNGVLRVKREPKKK